MVAPTWDLMSSPTMGRPASVNFWAQAGSEAMKTGSALTKATPASRAQVGDQHVGAGGLEGGDHVDGVGLGLLDGLPVVLAEPVVGGAALHGDAQRGHVGDLDGVVLGVVDRLGQVEADLLGVHVEGGHELDVRDVVVAEGDVHQPGHRPGRVGAAVVLHALDQGARAVADSHDCYSYRTHLLHLVFSVPRGRNGVTGRMAANGWCDRTAPGIAIARARKGVPRGDTTGWRGLSHQAMGV
jgi:hypothetical protein